MQIAIDGPAGAGKSTIAKRLARMLKAIYVDTGAMYRALTWKALQKQVDLEDEEALEKLARATKITFCEGENAQQVLCDGQEVTAAIRTPEVTEAVPTVARHPKVRRVMVALQQALAKENDIIMDGRDIGEKVLPEADFKFFVTASPEERAIRRMKEWEEKTPGISFEQVLREIKERDAMDAARSEGALKILPDSIEIDTTRLTIDGVIATMMNQIGGR